MRPSITLGLLLGAALTITSATIGGCHDSPAAAPQKALDNRTGTGGSGAGNDSGSTHDPPPTTAPVQPGPRPDTAIAPPAPLPASFTINGVALGAESRSDTTLAVRLPGVTAHLYRVKAADGSSVPEVLVGTAVTDAKGEFVFRDVPSAYYRLDVRAPAGGPYVDGSVSIAPPWSTDVGAYVVLHRKS